MYFPKRTGGNRKAIHKSTALVGPEAVQHGAPGTKALVFQFDKLCDTKLYLDQTYRKLCMYNLIPPHMPSIISCMLCDLI